MVELTKGFRGIEYQGIRPVGTVSPNASRIPSRQVMLGYNKESFRRILLETWLGWKCLEVIGGLDVKCDL